MTCLCALKPEWQSVNGPMAWHGTAASGNHIALTQACQPLGHNFKQFARGDLRLRVNMVVVNMVLAEYHQNACKLQIGPVDGVLRVFCRHFDGPI